MELEEAVKNLSDYIFAIDNFGTIDPKCCNNLYEPAKVVLQELKDRNIISEIEDTIVDVIPIYENEMFPTTKNVFHVKYKKLGDEKRESILKFLCDEMKRKFSDSKAIIILEKGMVIKVLCQ